MFQFLKKIATLVKKNYMKKISLFNLIILFIPLIVSAQNPEHFFNKSKMIETGVYYYPEAWDSTQWDRDFKKMAEMGFEFTHMADFAWAKLEPQEGKYDFVWLDKAVALAAKHGLKIIMCTPTAAPPAWLIQKYPEVLVLKDDGLLAQHGTRRHCSWSSKKYWELSAKIVTQMALHYRKDNRIWGWQIDNEPSHYGTVEYNSETRLHFIEWLKKKYNTIEALNFAWGTAFWSVVFSDFDQIELPNNKRLFSGNACPQWMMDFKRFSADECAAYISMQSNILKKYTSNEQWVTTNFMHIHNEVDPWRSKDIDFISYTMYPVAGYSKGTGDQGFRMGDFYRISLANDLYRPLKGVTGVMELQPGQVNWGWYNTQPMPGVIRAWMWNAFVGNLSFICSYRFREILYGSEQYHYGMIGTDGVTPTSGGLQYSQFIKEMRDIRKFYNSGIKNPQDYEERRTAILYNLDNVWMTEMQKQTYQWSFEGHYLKYYTALKQMTVPVDFINEEADFTKYKIMIAPAYQMLDNQLIERWKKFVEQGGQLVLTCRSGQMDRNGHLWEGPWAMPILDLIGGKINFYDCLQDDKKAMVKENETTYTWNKWAEVLTPNAGTEVWAAYADQFYSGSPAILHHKVGKGTVTYIGVETIDGKLEKIILQKIFDQASLKTLQLPEGMILDYRDGFGVAINYSSINAIAPLPANAKIIFGEKVLKPAGVVVWKEESK